MRRMIGYGTASPERAGQPPAPLRSPDAADHASIRDYLPALALGIGSLSALIYITFFSIAPDSPVAVVFPLSYSRFDAWNAALDAGGLVIREEFGGGVLIIQPQDAAFQQRIRDAGALFLMNPVLVGGVNPIPMASVTDSPPQDACLKVAQRISCASQLGVDSPGNAEGKAMGGTAIRRPAAAVDLSAAGAAHRRSGTLRRPDPGGGSPPPPLRPAPPRHGPADPGGCPAPDPAHRPFRLTRDRAACHDRPALRAGRSGPLQART